MRTRLVLLAIVATLLAAVMVGCGGGGGGVATTPGVTLTVNTDTALVAVKAASSRLVASAPLEAGATVVVYDYKTGTEIGRGTLDSNGQCNVSVTPGLTVAVVITGTHDGKAYRLSTIVPSVPTTDTTCTATLATSVAAESR
jgi:hypothetical protein